MKEKIKSWVSDNKEKFFKITAFLLAVIALCMVFLPGLSKTEVIETQFNTYFIKSISLIELIFGTFVLSFYEFSSNTNSWNLRNGALVTRCISVFALLAFLFLILAISCMVISYILENEEKKKTISVASMILLFLATIFVFLTTVYITTGSDGSIMTGKDISKGRTLGVGPYLFAQFSLLSSISLFLSLYINKYHCFKRK